MSELSIITPHLPNRKIVLDLAKQSYTDLEWIIVDDPLRRGCAWAKNKGAAQAKGDFLLFIDDDSTLTEGSLEALIAPLRTASPLTFTYPTLYANDPTGKIVGDEWNTERLHADNYIGGYFCVRREAFLGYDEHMLACDDWELYLRMADAQMHGIYVPAAKSLMNTRTDGNTDYRGGTALWRATVRAKHIAGGCTSGNKSIFDLWRDVYAQANSDTWRLFHEYLYQINPEQRHYNIETVQYFFDKLETLGVKPDVLEIGGWRGELADEILRGNTTIHRWFNREICEQAVATSIATDPRYATGIPKDDSYNVLVASHVLEHLKLADIIKILQQFPNLHYIYADMPIPHLGPVDWIGDRSFHVLEVNREEFEIALAQLGFSPIARFDGLPIFDFFQPTVAIYERA